ncbi:Unknown protein, partial [Striga hermonthica]
PESRERRQARKDMANRELKEKVEGLEGQFKAMNESMEDRFGSLDEGQVSTNAVVARLEQRLEEVLHGFQRQQQEEPPRVNARERLRQQEQQRAEHNPDEEEEYEQRSQASNVHERPRVEKPRLVLSTFTGTNLDAWLNRAVQFFDLNEMPQRDW